MDKKEILKYDNGKKIIVTLKDGQSFMGVMDPSEIEEYNSFLLGYMEIYCSDVREIRHKDDKKVLECFDKNIFGKDVDVLLNDGKKIRGKFTDDFEDTKEILVGDTMIKYRNIAAINEIVKDPTYELIYEENSDKPIKNNDDKYLYVEVSFDKSFSTYLYISNYFDIQLGDMVIVDAADNELEGRVVEMGYYEESEVPYPLDRTKMVKEVYRWHIRN